MTWPLAEDSIGTSFGLDNFALLLEAEGVVMAFELASRLVKTLGKDERTLYDCGC